MSWRFHTYYEILGLRLTATTEEITAVFNAYSEFRSKNEAWRSVEDNAHWARVYTASAILKTPCFRTVYDQMLRQKGFIDFKLPEIPPALQFPSMLAKERFELLDKTGTTDQLRGSLAPSPLAEKEQRLQPEKSRADNLSEMHRPMEGHRAPVIPTPDTTCPSTLQRAATPLGYFYLTSPHEEPHNLSTPQDEISPCPTYHQSSTHHTSSSSSSQATNSNYSRVAAGPASLSPDISSPIDCKETAAAGPACLSPPRKDISTVEPKASTPAGPACPVSHSHTAQNNVNSGFPVAHLPVDLVTPSPDYHLVRPIYSGLHSASPRGYFPSCYENPYSLMVPRPPRWRAGIGSRVKKATLLGRRAQRGGHGVRARDMDRLLVGLEGNIEEWICGRDGVASGCEGATPSDWAEN